MSEHVGPGDALLVVDVQNDFLPGGALGIRGGDAVVPVLNDYIRLFRSRGLPVYASRDWHPPNHCSFEAQGGPWPEHCVAGTRGAEFSPALVLPADVPVVSKATDPGREAYSALDGTDLEARLRRDGVRRLFIGGLATDYCVRWTAHDALAAGYEAVVLLDAVCAVDVRAGDGERALRAIRRRGARAVRRRRGVTGEAPGPPNRSAEAVGSRAVRSCAPRVEGPTDSADLFGGPVSSPVTPRPTRRGRAGSPRRSAR